MDRENSFTRIFDSLLSIGCSHKFYLFCINSFYFLESSYMKIADDISAIR